MPPINIGSIPITALRIGAQIVNAAYVGGNLVYSDGEIPVTPSARAAIVVLLGQSLNAPRGTVVKATATAGGLMPAGGASITNWAFFAANATTTGHWDELSSAVPYTEETGQTPGSGIIDTLSQSPAFGRIYIGNVAIGARTLEVLMTGGPNNNLSATLHRLCAIARADGYSPEVYFYTAHGEANASSGSTEQQYYDLGRSYYERCRLYARHAMRNKAYIAPIVFTYPVQQSAGAGEGDRAIKRAIRRLTSDLPNAIDLGAIYQWPVEADRTHPTPDGYVQRGEAVGRVIAQFADSATEYDNLRITAVTLSGVTATVTFSKSIVRDITLGVGQNLNTAFAEDGFEWIDNGTPIAITSVAYSGSTATLTLASAPTGAAVQQVCRIAVQTTTAALTAGAQNLSGSVVRSIAAGWPSNHVPAYMNYEWASPQSIVGVAQV